MNLFDSPISFFTKIDALALLTEFFQPLETESGQLLLKENTSD